MHPRSVVQVVRSDSFSGVERYICDVSTELSGRGWDVKVIGGDPGVMVPRLPPTVVHAPASSVFDVLRALAGSRGYGLVHVHMTAAEIAAVATHPLLRVPILSTRHFAARRGSSRPMRVLSPVIRRSMSQQIAISRFVAEALAEPAHVLHNGVEDGPDPPGAVRSPTVLVLQRHDYEKNTDLALRAWAQSRARDDGWRLLVCGRGPLTESLRALALRLEVADSIDFLGFVADPRRYLASSGLLLAPAPAEPFGLAVVEAMAFGMPILAANGGAHRETLDGAARLFDPGDVDDCARQLNAMVDDPTERARLGRLAMDRQRSLFTVKAHVDGLESIYAAVSGR